MTASLFRNWVIISSAHSSSSALRSRLSRLYLRGEVAYFRTRVIFSRPRMSALHAVASERPFSLFQARSIR